MNLLISCNPQKIEPTGARLSSSGGLSTGVTNSTLFQGRIMASDPATLAGGKDRVSYPVDLNRFANQFRYITANPQLKTCQFNFQSGLQSILPTLTSQGHYGCFEVQDHTGGLINRPSSGWNFNANTKEFLQVNTFYHTQEALKKFMQGIRETLNRVHFNSQLLYPSSYPMLGVDFAPNAYWHNIIQNESSLPQSLVLKPVCDLKNNASYSPATFEICMGYISNKPDLFLAQDPSIIYHEVAHGLVDIFMNARNSQFSFKSNLGNLFYDEAGAINEGIADYFSFLMNGLDTFSPWALGKYLNADRPMRESSHVHPEFIRNQASARVSYPDFVHYNAYDSASPVEDIHYSGQIVTHFFTRLTDELHNKCTMNRVKAGETVFAMIGETLSRLGDLTASASDYNQSDLFYQNLNQDHAYLWSKVVNPPNFRSFFQTFSRNMLYHVLLTDCMGKFSKSQYEKLLDDYGLLLFSTYNDAIISSNGESEFSEVESDFFPINIDTRLELTEVDLTQKDKTTLVSKNLIDLVTEFENQQNPLRPIAYVFDKQADISKALAALSFQGQKVNISSGLAGAVFNNGNSRISPGEVVGVSLNLVNRSNIPLAGVQILANDWDHMKFDYSDGNKLKPCRINNFPTQAQGAASSDFDPDDPEEGDCNYITRENGGDPFDDELSADPVVPVCMVEYRENNQIKVVNQDIFRRSNQIANHECLNSVNPKNATNNYECLVRMLPGGEQAFYSKLDPQKTLVETLQGPQNQAASLNMSSVLFMEVNKWVPPGTTFICRMRVRFTNCSDCFEDSERDNDNYHDYEYSGAKPFKVVNFKFVVID